MKTLLKIAGGFYIALLLSINSTFAQSPPPFPTDPFNDSWSFYNPTNWASDEGHLPIAYTNIICDQSAWSSDDGILDCNALLLDNTNAAAFLNYRVIENNGHTNLSCSEGTLWFWFSPDWDSQSQGGTGPGDWGRFVEVGAYTTNAASGWWSLLVSPDGNTIYFSGQTNGAGTNYLNAPIAWTAGSWHLIGLTYTATNSILYIDDQVATNGLGVLYPPNHEVLTNGFWIGSDVSGTQQARGQFVDVESWNTIFSGAYFSSYYNEMLPELPGAGFRMGGFAMDSFSPSDFSSGSSSNFPDTYGTNLWLYLAGIQTNTIGLFLINTEPDVSYEIQAKTNLLQTNWLSEGFVLGSELTNFTEMDLPQGIGTNALFMRIRSWADDGSGLPLWWQQLYFGTTGVDPYGDPDGDGWNNLQEFQNGTNPNSFDTPPAPSGLTVNYNSFSNKATVAWQTSPGPVTGYTVQDSDGNTFNFGAGTNGFVDDVSSDGISDLLDSGPTIGTTYRIQAHYAGGDSAWSGDMALERDSLPYLSAAIIAGSQGSAYLAASPLPPGTMALKVTGVDESDFNNPFIFTNFNVSVSGVTSGLYSLPNIVTPSKAHTYPYTYTNSAYCYWYVQAVGTNGNLSMANYVAQNYGIPNIYSSNRKDWRGWLVPPYFDGRTQLKQNLIFQLRAAMANFPFQFSDNPTNGYVNYLPVMTTTNYAYAGFYQFIKFKWDDGTFGFDVELNATEPFEENYVDRNFVYNSSELNIYGHTLTGAGGGYYVTYDNTYFGGLTLQEPAAYQFQQVPTNGATIAAVLGTNDTRWLASFPLDTFSSYTPYVQIGVTNFGTTNFLAANAVNYFGLPILSVKITYNGGNLTLNAGNHTTQWGYFYPETAQPQLQLVDYEFWQNTALFPGMPDFPTNTNPLITSVGNAYYRVGGYAKLAVLNGYSGAYGFLGQYFDKAYKIINGVVTTNTTGVLSSYGNFFATEPGPAALVTMPDLDTGARGTGTVYAVSLALDKNHDGNMDLSFNGTDATSQGQPFVFWANNNYDRWATSEGVYGLLYTEFEQDDLQFANCPYTPNTATPDSEYRDFFGNRIIPCARDLEDFSRLWINGVTSNLLASLPSGSTVTLSWADIWDGAEYTQSGNPTIDLFQAADADGGIGYLTNSTIAANQIDPAQSGYVGRISPGQSVQLNANFFGSTWRGNHFIWCGVSNGTGGLTLTITDANSNILAQSSAYIQIEDIKQMYERWTVGDKSSVPPLTNAVPVTEDLPVGMTAFKYTPPQDTNTPYILLVHGYNMATWEKDTYAQTAFKRLYWQGYQGRFGAFNWPTPLQGINPRAFDNSESQAWNSGQGLLNKLNDLNAQYPGQVYLLAHSLGNVVAGEALRLAGTNQVVNTYVAMQGAVDSHTYDPTRPTRSVSFSTPDRCGEYYTSSAPSYFNGSAGAGTYVNFFNTNDWALATNVWQRDENEKPDFGYSYSAVDDSWEKESFSAIPLAFPQDTYTIFSYCDQAHGYALGAQANVGGAFLNVSGYHQIELDADPYNFGRQHIYHSGEFRSDNTQRWQFWYETLHQMGLK